MRSTYCLLVGQKFASNLEEVLSVSSKTFDELALKTTQTRTSIPHQTAHLSEMEVRIRETSVNKGHTSRVARVGLQDEQCRSEEGGRRVVPTDRQGENNTNKKKLARIYRQNESESDTVIANRHHHNTTHAAASLL